ncbi:hypothetical protein GA0061078_1170 [Bifidobacterium bohemicum]|uniref:Carbon starvation protein n=1 Tax=Bifidobacterium bohemicum DSM 22767 TaxID=1437606 RepID=A0A086ZGD8_9BIFI|nr:hypothetical protein [Bifidobacterium bohemicum]KFI45588.1 carbon starvation protein [Bifidobacterium bohemicum DSM 22767]SCC01270.1 hypothetical protein GA0061078_1170 [Bifidobacterium bohemicum]
MNNVVRERFYAVGAVGGALWLVDLIYQSQKDGSLFVGSTIFLAVCIFSATIYFAVGAWRLWRVGRHGNVKEVDMFEKSRPSKEDRAGETRQKSDSRK